MVDCETNFHKYQFQEKGTFLKIRYLFAIMVATYRITTLQQSTIHPINICQHGALDHVSLFIDRFSHATLNRKKKKRLSATTNTLNPNRTWTNAIESHPLKTIVNELP